MAVNVLNILQKNTIKESNIFFKKTFHNFYRSSHTLGFLSGRSCAEL